MAEVETLTPVPLDSPPEVDGAPHNSDVAAGSQELALSEQPQDGERKVVKKVMKKKRRPARPQVDPSTLKAGELPPQTGTVFNIWYNKWSGGDREDKYASKVHAESRCSIAKDSGYTRADKVPGSYFCLFFARGLCPKGHECEYLHRLPTIHDLFNPNIDCFGRDKHSDYRDDMGGVGSFMRQNRTLYVGRIHVSDDIEEIVARHFAEWGQIERIRVLNSRGVAFITYTNEASSQFAKEAMAHQSLDHNEILNVRWATVDPNPMAQAREKRKIEEQAAEAVRKALPADFVAELEGRDPEAKKRKRIEGSFGLAGYDAPDEVWYARGSTAVNPSGRQDVVGGSERPLAIAEAGQEEREQDGGGGIISGSTLEALKSYSIQSKSGIITAQASKAVSSGGPLVAYGSDDDSD
ncbi:MAG: Pre-mRNA-splicing factor [Geoglossum umbratile]|nr:MAG: Pre-mRNA-splicing factor [Geoglossum umbratile]